MHRPTRRSSTGSGSTDVHEFLRSQQEKLEAARIAELQRRIRLVALFVPVKWISLRHKDLASVMSETPKIIVTPQQ